MITPEPQTTPYNTRSRSQSRDKIDQEQAQPKNEPTSTITTDYTINTEKPPWQHETVAQPPISTTDTSTFSSVTASFHTSIQQLTQSIHSVRAEAQDNLQLMHERLEQQQQEQYRLAAELQLLPTSGTQQSSIMDEHKHDVK